MFGRAPFSRSPFGRSNIIDIITGYILERKVNDGEWIQLEIIEVENIGELEEPLTLSGELDKDYEMIIIEGN